MNASLLLFVLTVALASLIASASTSAQVCQPLDYRPRLDGETFTAFVLAGEDDYIPQVFKDKTDHFDQEPKGGLYHGNSTITTDCATIRFQVTKDLAGESYMYFYDEMTYAVRDQTQSCKLRFEGLDGDGSRYACIKNSVVRGAIVSKTVAYLTVGNFNFH